MNIQSLANSMPWSFTELSYSQTTVKLVLSVSMQYTAIHRYYYENENPLNFHSTQLRTTLTQFLLWKQKLPSYQDLDCGMFPCNRKTLGCRENMENKKDNSLLYE